MQKLYLVVVCLLALSLECMSAKSRKHRFNVEDEVPFFVNKIGPYQNPSETYEFYSLPFCRPTEDKIQHKHLTIGEDLKGDHKVSSLYDIRFRVPINWDALCKVHLKQSELEAFKKAIDKLYYFEMSYDDLPIRNFVGTVDGDRPDEPKKYYLFKHLHFHILYNNDRIIFVNATADPHKVAELGDEETMVEFSYSATWEETDWPFEKRMQLYEDFFSKELEIHWLSIMNSFVLVLLLTGFLAIIIMRILKSDYNRYSKATDEEEEEDYGWKLIHGHVFRFPSFKNLFTAFIGLGTQCIFIFFSLLSLALMGIFYPNNNGAVYTAGVVLYALTSVVGGFTSARYYKQMGGESWAWNIVLVGTLFLVPVVVVFSFVNTVAVVYKATPAVPALTIVIVLILLVSVGFPLTIIGGVAGRRTASDFEAPCRTKNFPREIPPIPWYRSLPFQMMMSGFLPFSAIYIELFYLYSSIWGHTTYQLFGILFLVAIILLIVTACITVALTYFQLSMEDHRWWWSSFLSGGSTGLFIYAYSIFYYVYRSKMSGVLQASFYFSWMAVACYFFFVMLGTVGWFSSLVFVRRIYKDIHTD